MQDSATFQGKKAGEKIIITIGKEKAGHLRISLGSNQKVLLVQSSG